MTTLRRLAAGALSLVTLGVLLAGIPLALVIVAGWPLPHSWPSMTQVRNVLETSGISDTLLIDTLALVCWIAWLDFALATVVELASAVAGRPARRVPLLRTWQPVVARLITTVVVAWSAMGSRPSPAAPPQGATLAVAIAGRHGAAALSGPAVPPRQEPPASVAASASPAPSDEYVVHRGDTLWGISQRRLGDARRWPEMWRRNEDRPEPDGRRFTDPNLILPSWRLDIPGQPGQERPPIPPSPRDTGGPKTTPAGGTPAQVPIPQPATTIPPPPSTPSSAAAPATPPPPPAASAPTPPQTRGGITLPEGGFVGIGFAAGIVTGLAAARWHERRRRRIGTVPSPSVEALVGPAMTQMQRAVRAATERDGAALTVLDEPPATSTCRRLGRIPVGVRVTGGATADVEADVVELSGLAFVGPGAEAAASALIAATSSADWRDQAETLIVGTTTRLLAGVGEVPGACSVEDGVGAVARLRAECAQRERILAANEADDYRALAGSDDPLGALLVVADGQVLSAEDGETLASLVHPSRRLGIAIIVVGSASGFETVEVGADGSVEAGPVWFRGGMVTRLFTIRPAEAHEVLAVLSAGRGGPVQVDASDGSPPPHLADLKAPDSPEESEARGTRPVVVRLYGPPRVEVSGTEVATGLREKARELLSLLALRRSGIRIDEALTEMWADDDERHRDTLHVSVTATRALLRRLTGIIDGRFIAHAAQRYSLDPDLVDADAWKLEQCLAEAARASEDDQRREALGRIVPLLDGPPLEGADYEWAAAPREHLRRLAVDALAELARLRSEAGDADGALAALERARAVDPPCEDVHRRLMRQLVAAGREEVALRVYDEVECHAAQLGTLPEEETEDLMVEIRGRIRSGKANGGQTADAASQAFAARQNGTRAQIADPSPRRPSRVQHTLPILDEEGPPPV